MTGEQTIKVELVKCPKCLEVLPLLEDIPIYKCGGCGTLLQAKGQQNGTSTREALHEASISQKNERYCESEDNRLYRSNKKWGGPPSEQLGHSRRSVLSGSAESYAATEYRDHCSRFGGNLGKLSNSSTIRRSTIDKDPYTTRNCWLGEIGYPKHSRYHHPNMNWGVSESGRYQYKTQLHQENSVADCKSLSSSSRYNESESNSIYLSPTRLGGIKQEKMELLGTVYELEDQLNKTRRPKGATSGEGPMEVGRRERNDLMYNNQEAYDEFVHDLHYTTNPERHMASSVMNKEEKFPRTAYSGEVANSKHRADYPCNYLPRDYRFSAPLFPSIPRMYRGLNRSHTGCYSAYSSCPSSSLPYKDCKYSLSSDVQSNDPLDEDYATKRHSRKHYFLPKAGGAPFVTCYRCLNLLQLPADLVLFETKSYRLKCGYCSTVLKFSFQDRAHAVPHSRNLTPHPHEVDNNTDVSNEKNKASSSHANSSSDPLSHSLSSGSESESPKSSVVVNETVPDHRSTEVEKQFLAANEELQGAEENILNSLEAEKTRTYEKMMERLSKYEEDLRVSSLKLELSEREVTTLRSELEKSEFLVRNVQAQLKEAEEMVKTNEINLEIEKKHTVEMREQILDTNISESEKLIEKLTEELEVTRERLMTSDQENAKLKKDIADKSSAAHELQCQMERAQENRVALESTLESEIRRVSELQERIAQYESDMSDREDAVEELKVALADALEKFSLEKRALESKLDSERRQVSELQEQMAKRESDITDREHEVQALNVALADASEKFSLEKATLESKLNSERRQVAELQDRITKYEVDISDHEHEVLELKVAQSDACEMFSMEKTRLESEIHDLSAKNIRLSTSVEELELRRKSLEDKIAQLEAEKLEIIHLHGVKDLEMQSEFKRLLSELHERGANIMQPKSLEDKITQLEAEKLEMQCEIHRLKEELVKNETDLKAIKEDYESLKLRYDMLEKEVEQERKLVADMAEEKREAIRQLCLDMEHYRSRYQKLQQAFSLKKQYSETSL